MSSSTQRHLDLVLRDAVKEYKQALADQLQAIYSSHASKGRLQSGATIRVAIAAMDQIACDAVQSMSSKAFSIARDSDTFAALSAAINDLIEFFRDELPPIIRTASGRMSVEANPSIEAAALALFDEMDSKIERKVEIAKYQFSNEPLQAPVANKGQDSKAGRRRSAFWDDMWASIARDLYEGDLKPQTQAEIERAMLEWIEAHGYSAAVSTVRARARRLWDLICAG